MKKLIDELEEITKKLIYAKSIQDRLERTYAIKKANIFTKVMDQFKNAEAREAQATLDLENSESTFLDTLYEARGLSRELSLTRECLLESIRDRRSRSFSE